MPKLASPSPSSLFKSSRIIHSRPHLHPQSKLPSRCASSHTQPLAHSQIHYDIPPSASYSPNRLSPVLSQPPFDFKYSLTDDLNPPNQNDHKPPNERTLKLGKTLRILSPLLPTILVNPLPPHILSPSVALHLFPSTHPHLPTVKGRTLYRAALWAVPVAWSSVPLVGNVKLQILGERIVRAGTVLDPHLNADGNGNGDCGDERLVVRWRTERTHSTHASSSPLASSGSTAISSQPNTTTTVNNGSSSSGTNKGLSVLLGGDAPIFKLSSDDQFTGLFIFSFDEEGRVITQTIEHAEDASGWERTAKFVTLTDWLIGKARGSLDPSPAPGLVGCSDLGSGGSSTHGKYRERDFWRGEEGRNNETISRASSL
ncbi:hypothetical protein BDV12DRAFT_170013 [Aspergillus spectabilis]